MIHETAIVDKNAKLGSNVSIGPWSYIGPDVEIGDDCVVESHVVIKGPSKIGKNNHFFQFSSIGEACQDKKYAGEPTRLEIGDNNMFRESCTVHRGTVQDNSLTKIGSGNLFMAYCHVAHDCMIGNDNILANNATLAGHVHVADQVILGGFTGVHQFCKIGNHAFCAVGSVVLKDIPPYTMVAGQNAKPHGINSEGLKRRGYSKEQVSAIRNAYKVIYRQGLTLDEALEQLNALAREQECVQIFIDFIGQSNRGLIR